VWKDGSRQLHTVVGIGYRIAALPNFPPLSATGFPVLVLWGQPISIARRLCACVEHYCWLHSCIVRQERIKRWADDRRVHACLKLRLSINGPPPVWPHDQLQSISLRETCLHAHRDRDARTVSRLLWPIIRATNTQAGRRPANRKKKVFWIGHHRAIEARGTFSLRIALISRFGMWRETCPIAKLFATILESGFLLAIKRAHFSVGWPVLFSRAF
jgi:hypothetical protein